MFYIGGILENQDDVASWLAYIKKSPLRRLKKKRPFGLTISHLKAAGHLQAR
jgi:hypothetical protein